MASKADVKKYLAYWFQLGKKVVDGDGKTICQPKTVLQGDRFSQEFEQCWATILSADTHDYTLEGTNETIATLLSPAWTIESCARCDMPVPMPEVELSQHPCPCNDLPNWPNTELPQPRMPINSNHRLNDLKARIESKLAAHGPSAQIPSEKA
ncbi:MAG: hypothetical protein AAFQ74_15275 [Cyanobacteria bacterium J06623_4]